MPRARTNFLCIKLSIPQPCSKTWEQMLPENNSKYCLNCEKTVIDFSQYSDRQIISFFKQHNKNVCGRLSMQQLASDYHHPKIIF